MTHPEVVINGINLRTMFKAVLAQKHSVQPPVAKTSYQDVPGADGAADLSTAVSGRITYNRREITMMFQCDHPENKWATIFSEILKEFHGREGKIIFGDDPSYYYTGRMEVSDYDRSRTFGKFVIKVNAEPYKNELLSSLEPWLWSPFNFKTGVIRAYKDLDVNGERVLTIPGTEKWQIPTFITEGTMTVSFNGKTYNLAPGKSKIYSIAVKPGANTFIFRGNGIVSVDYRGGKL